MKTNLRQTKLTLLLGLLALSGLTAYAYRASEQWRGHSAAPAGQPTAILSHPRERAVVTLTSAAAVTHSEVSPKAEDAEPAAALEPAQSGGSYNITQSVIPGGGGTSANGNTNVIGTVGQSAAAASSGGIYTVNGGFWGGAAGGGCPAITVNPANPTLTPGTQGTAYTQTFTQTLGNGAITWSNPGGGLPGNLLLDALTGVLSGTPTTQGTFNFIIRATDANQCTGERAYRLVINPLGCPMITVNPSNPTLTAGAVGTAYTQTFTQSGGTGVAAFTMSPSNVAGGLTLTAAGALIGTPVQSGNFTFTVTATDANGCTGQRQYALTVAVACAGLTINPTSASIPASGANGTVNVAAGAGCAWTAASNAAWLTINSGASGTGNGAVAYTVAANPGAQRTGTLTIAGQTFTVTQSAANQPPAPALTSLTPKLALMGGAAFTLTLTGANFANTCQARWNGQPRATTLVSAAQLTAEIPASDLAVEATVSVTVFDTANNQSSGGQTFRVVSPLANVSAASYQDAGVAADSIVAAFGAQMATAIEAATTIPLPTMLAGTTVRVTDSAGVERLAPLFFVSPSQINYLLPQGTALGTATVIVTSGAGHISLGYPEITTVAPGLFTVNATGNGLAAAQVVRVKPDGQQIYEDVAKFDPVTQTFVAVPIDLTIAGDAVVLVLYGTGIRGRSALNAVNLAIPDTALEAGYAGATLLAGLDQINALLSNSLAASGERNVTLMVDGKAANRVKLTFK